MTNVRKQWMAEISEVDELLGQEPRYPHALIQSHITKELDKQNEVVRSSSAELRESILNSTSDVCGTLENGFELMVETNSEGFDKLDNSLQVIDSTLSWGFSKLIELSRLIAVLLEEIIQLLNIPDIEKERKLNIERGLDFFKKSKIDPSFLNDSKKYFENALRLEENDYFVLYNLGLIHLYSNDHLDFSKAKKYFLKASKYSNADINFKSVEYTPDKSSFKNPINPKTIATYSFLYASRCENKLGDNENALTLAQKAYALSPNIAEVAYDTSKYLALNNKLENSKNVLSRAIDLDRFTTLKVLKDKDLIIHREIKSLLKSKKDNALNMGTELYSECQKIISSNSIYTNELNKVISLLSKKTFLDSMSAIDILDPQNKQ